MKYIFGTVLFAVALFTLVFAVHISLSYGKIVNYETLKSGEMYDHEAVRQLGG